MIWLTWRQHRKQALYTLIALAVLAAVMLPTGLAMHHSYVDSGLAACVAKFSTAQVIPGNGGTGPDCGELFQRFQNQYGALTFIPVLFLVLPLFVGIFLGAPLVAREVEHGTHRLVWTQGVSRRHWALVKFGLIGLIALIVAAVYTLGMDWWSRPLLGNGGRMGPIVFDFEGVAPIGYTLFAVAAGIFAGTQWKRIVPAMGVTVAGYAVVRVLVEVFARSRYLTPLTASFSIQADEQFNNNSGAWIYSQGVINGTGKDIVPGGYVGCGGGSGNTMISSGSIIAPGSDPCNGGLLTQGLGPAPFSNWMQYQPASRFWALQGIETGIFLALAALLVFLAVRGIRRIA